MVQFIFEGSRTNFSFWSKFAYVLVRTGVCYTSRPTASLRISLQHISYQDQAIETRHTRYQISLYNATNVDLTL